MKLNMKICCKNDTLNYEETFCDSKSEPIVDNQNIEENNS